MKKSFFLVLWFSIPIIPAFLYAYSAGIGLDQYGLSIILGVYAFTLLTGQFLLITRPQWMQKLYSVKGIVSLHSVIPVFVLFIALTHRFLKEGAGFSLESVQAIIGLIGWFFLLLIIVMALLLLANTGLEKISAVRKLRAKVSELFGLNYPKIRATHNMTVLLSLVLCVHVGMAYSTSFTSNVLGSGFLLLWVVFCLGSYIVYRIRGRK